MLCLTFRPCLPIMRNLLREHALYHNLKINLSSCQNRPSLLCLGEDILHIIVDAEYNSYSNRFKCSSRLGKSCRQLYNIYRPYCDQRHIDFLVYVMRKGFKDDIRLKYGSCALFCNYHYC